VASKGRVAYITDDVEGNARCLFQILKWSMETTKTYRHGNIGADFKNSGDLADTEQDRQSLHLRDREVEHNSE